MIACALYVIRGHKSGKACGETSDRTGIENSASCARFALFNIILASAGNLYSAGFMQVQMHDLCSCK